MQCWCIYTSIRASNRYSTPSLRIWRAGLAHTGLNGEKWFRCCVCRTGDRLVSSSLCLCRSPWNNKSTLHIWTSAIHITQSHTHIASAQFSQFAQIWWERDWTLCVQKSKYYYLTVNAHGFDSQWNSSQLLNIVIVWGVTFKPIHSVSKICRTLHSIHIHDM